LNVVGEVMANPASISQVSNLHRDDLFGEIVTTFRGWRGFVLERYACEILFQGIAENQLAQLGTTKW
jgi:hypothetical protein